jgi:hypothetical protein
MMEEEEEEEQEEEEEVQMVKVHCVSWVLWW